MVRMLEAHGVKHIFGLCGDTTLPFYDALYRLEHKIDHILTRDERSASYMADGYSRVTNKVGVCEGPSGGGAIHFAGRGRSKRILVCRACYYIRCCHNFYRTLSAHRIRPGSTLSATHQMEHHHSTLRDGTRYGAPSIPFYDHGASGRSAFRLPHRRPARTNGCKRHMGRCCP